MSKRCLVSCASYRDPELIHTIQSLIDNCENPSDLDIHIFMQYGDELTPFSFLTQVSEKGASIKIHAIPYQESKGVCYARHFLQNQWSGHDYFLQIDSHHVFTYNWLNSCIEQIEALKKVYGGKNYLTTYLTDYSPQNRDKLKDEIWRLTWDRWIPEGNYFVIPCPITNYAKMKLPERTRYFSGHFLFAEGIYCKECLYDPNFWFHGEEPRQSLVNFTNNWNGWIPMANKYSENGKKSIAYHEYTRKERPKVWDDIEWVERNKKSHQRFRQLTYMEPRTIDFKEFDFGKERSLRDYEKFAGIHFKKRAVQAETLMGKEPPNLFNYKNWKDWEKSFICIRRHCLDLWYKELPENLDELDFVAVIYEYEGEQLFREDIKGIKLKSIYKERADNKEDFYKFWSEFQNDLIPSNAVIWPYLKDKGWGKKLDFNLRN